MQGASNPSNLIYGTVRDSDPDNDVENGNLHPSVAGTVTTTSRSTYIPPPSCEKETFSHYISVVANATNALLGVSIFMMPWGFMQSGLVGGSFITFFVAGLSFQTADGLLEAQKILYQRTGDVLSYPEVAGIVLGASWSSVVQMATAISCLGGCVGFLIFLGALCSQLFDISLVTAILAAVVPLILLSWVRSFQELAIFTVVGLFAIIGAVIAVLFDGSKHVHKDWASQTPWFQPMTSSLEFLGPATFFFTIHYCVSSLGAEGLERIDKPRSKKMSLRLLAPGSENGMSSPGMGSGAATPTVEPAAVNPHSLLNNGSLLDATTMKLSSSSSSQDADGVQDSEQSMEEMQPVTTGITTKPLFIAYILAIILVIVHGASGFIFYRQVPIVRMSNGKPEPGCEHSVCQNVILNLADGALKDIVGYSLCIAIVLSYVILLAPARENIESVVLRRMDLCSRSSIEITRNVIRASLVIGTAVIAIIAPYFGSVLGAVGGLTDALQSFVLPPLICMRLSGHSMTWSQKLFYRSVLVWGVCTIMYTISKIMAVVYQAAA